MDAVPLRPPLFWGTKNTTLHELQTGDRSRATDSAAFSPLIGSFGFIRLFSDGTWIGTRLAMSPRYLPHRLRLYVHRRRCDRISRTTWLRRGGYVRLRQRCHPGSIAYAARIDRCIVYSTSVPRTARNTTDRHISHTRRTSG